MSRPATWSKVSNTDSAYALSTSKLTIPLPAIPKKNVTFAFSLPLPADQEGKLRDLRFELHGSNIVFKSADRASRKFKAKGAKGLDF